MELRCTKIATTDRDIKLCDEVRYKVEKGDIKTDKVTNAGIYNESDMKSIIKGYHFNGMFYEKKNSDTIYVVTKVN